MIRSRAVVSVVYYGVVGALLLLALLGLLDDLFGRSLGQQLAENSEGLLLALGLPAWVQLVRPRLAGTAREWPVTLAVSAACVLIGVGLISADSWPSRVFTLNEAFLGLAVLVPYVQLHRPVPRALSVGLPAAVVLLVLVASRTALVTDLAEMLAMVVLVPLGLDLVDRGVLEPGARTAPAVRWAWYAFLVVAPAAIALLNGVFSGVLQEAVRYLVRVQEAWVGLLLLEVHLAVLLPWATSGDRRPGASERAVAAQV